MTGIGERGKGTALLPRVIRIIALHDDPGDTPCAFARPLGRDWRARRYEIAQIMTSLSTSAQMERMKRNYARQLKGQAQRGITVTCRSVTPPPSPFFYLCCRYVRGRAYVTRKPRHANSPYDLSGSKASSRSTRVSVTLCALVPLCGNRASDLPNQKADRADARACIVVTSTNFLRHGFLPPSSYIWATTVAIVHLPSTPSAFFS